MSLRAKRSNLDPPAQRNPGLVYVIAGDDPSLVNAKYTELIGQLVPHAERDTGLLVVDADKAVIGEILDELQTIPFFTKRKIVALRNADKFISAGGDEENEQDKQDGQSAPAAAGNREILEKYFENPSPTGILVITVKSWPKSTRLAKKLPTVGTLIEVKSPKGQELTHRLIDYAREAHSKGLDDWTAGLLVELAGDNLTQLYTEIDKLAAYAATEKAITAAHVEALIGRNREFDAFEVIESCLQRKTGPAIERLRKMFAEDKSAEYTTIGAFAFHIRRLFTAKKMLMEGQSQYEVAGKARIFYNKEAHFALLKRLTLKQLGDQLQQLAETDYAIKRGLAQPRIAIEQFVLQLASL
ncbi:MAG: DNA polymerase III subunit delta [Sedimentisphaerales bacterium]|jgi:DNA polymerase-3 subunit delta